MISFILNNTTIHTEMPSGMTVLDFVRYHQNLKGTKIGCREGDCGACVVLIGKYSNDHVNYQSMTSCLMPLINAHGKHIVTIEGINNENGKLTPVQQAMVEENGTQCGFCTPGFVVSLTGYCLAVQSDIPESAIGAIDGNICRCTGYKSIERAATKIHAILNSDHSASQLSYAIENGIVPEWFLSIKNRLIEMQQNTTAKNDSEKREKRIMPFAGGTDVYVQRPEEMMSEPSGYSLFDDPSLRGIFQTNTHIEIGGSVTVTDLLESELMFRLFPHLGQQLKLVSSTPIRNMATIAGNLVNASPIGDLTIWLLALNANVVLRNNETREIPLREFYIDYKQTAKSADEIVEKIRFPIPDTNHFFHFEKVSKRTFLDIASVNTAVQLHVENNKIKEAHVSAGGVAPIPLYLKETSLFLKNKKVPTSDEEFSDIYPVLQSEINPISDVRGSEAYKRLLLQQLFRAHFIELFSTT